MTHELSDACDAAWLAYCKRVNAPNGRPHDEWLAFRAAYAAGRESVPREPTIQMIQAGCESYIECQRAEIAYACTSGQQPAKGPEHIWRAMHDAATGGQG